MKNQFIKEKYTYHGAGFPVTILHAPFKEVAGEEVLDVDLDKLELGLARLILLKPALLSGPEIKFLRVFTHHSLTAFASYFNLTPAGVKRWEDKGNHDYGNDFLIRQVIAKKIGMEHGFNCDFVVHQSVLKRSEYQKEPFPEISIQSEKIKTDPLFNAAVI